MKGYRIRHSQLFFRKGPGRAIYLMEGLIRIGDLVALMLCAEYAKQIEGRRIAFQLLDDTHKALRAEVLFSNTIDDLLTVEGPGFGLQDPGALEIFDPGPLWIAATHYHSKYGARLVPRLSFDPALYRGPELEWGSYAVFHPLFAPAYNEGRGMEEGFVNTFCDQLVQALGDRALVVTDHPEKIHSSIRVVATESLYDLVYLIGRSKVYLGGDTGFTHFAAAGRVPHLFALYGPNYFHDFVTAYTDICFGDLVHPFATLGTYIGTPADTRPKHDPAATNLHFHVLGNNRLPASEMEAVVVQVRAILDGGA